MSLSAEQLSDLQADLSIGSDQGVFTDNELNRLYERASEDYDSTLVLAWRQLLASANRFNDYTAGQTSEKKSQVRAHIRDTLEYYEDRVQRSGNQVAIVGMRRVPPVYKEVPAGEEQPDIKNRRHNVLINPDEA